MALHAAAAATHRCRARAPRAVAAVAAAASRAREHDRRSHRRVAARWRRAVRVRTARTGRTPSHCARRRTALVPRAAPPVRTCKRRRDGMRPRVLLSSAPFAARSGAVHKSHNYYCVKHIPPTQQRCVRARRGAPAASHAARGLEEWEEGMKVKDAVQSTKIPANTLIIDRC